MMEDSQSYIVPAGIDAPIPIFKWEVVEVITAIMAMGVCLILQKFFTGIVCAMFILWLAKKFKAGAKRGEIQHLIWRLGLNLDTPLKLFGPPSTRLEYMR